MTRVPTGAFDALDRELDRWSALERLATFWLRDDDACRDSPALQRLLAIAAANDVPVAVAAIPALAEASLGEAVARCPGVTLLQHGYAHRNHASPGERGAELGDARSVGDRLDELARGREYLARAFGDRFAPILVPPWNRIGDDLLPHLAGAGFAGLSRFAPRAARDAAPGLLEINTHVDPIAWRRERQFVGADVAIERLVAHLRARREHACDPDEPTGLLTHHLAFTDAGWDFVATLLHRTRRHRAGAWLDAAQAFGLTPRATDASSTLRGAAPTCGRSA
jgi:peptidoglycan/xylan/chitin deacetylase (PgdA/CDA1 family)